MDGLARLIRTRLLPAALTAAGVALVSVGLLTYTDPATAGVPPAPAPSPTVRATPRPTPTLAPTPSSSPDASGSPGASATPSGSPTPPPDRTVTRVAVPALQIDLPVIPQPDPAYPSCDVAMYHEAFDAPGLEHGPYLYAHARTGMFLALLDASKVQNGAAMIGMLVQIWTSDDRLFLYEVTEVRRHVPTGDDLTQLWKMGRDVAWLQTSEGPNSSYPKLQIVARLLSEQAADPADAHPAAKPRDC